MEQLERQSKEIKTNGVMSPPRTRARQSSGTGGGMFMHHLMPFNAYRCLYQLALGCLAMPLAYDIMKFVLIWSSDLHILWYRNTFEIGRYLFGH